MLLYMLYRYMLYLYALIKNMRVEEDDFGVQCGIVRYGVVWRACVAWCAEVS